MDEGTLSAIGVAVAMIVLGIVVFMTLQKRKTDQLRRRFGPEYDHALKEIGDRGRAAALLQEREKRVEHLKIRQLSTVEAVWFRENWWNIQRQFVDDPKVALTNADQLLGHVMAKRGYPNGNFEQRAADISVEHPRVVAHYRAGHQIALRLAKGQASTEELRQAILHYRTLLTDLIGEMDTPSAGEIEK